MCKESARASLLIALLVVPLVGCRSTIEGPVASLPPQAEAIQAAEIAPEVHGSSEPASLLAQAEADLNAERFGVAEETLRDILKLSPEDRHAHHLLGQVFFEMGRYTDAKIHFERAIALDDRDPMTHLWMGKVLAEEIERAMIFAKLPLAKRLLAGFERAVELAPESVPVQTALARYHLEAPAMAGGSAEKLQHHIDTLSRLDAAAAHRLEARRHLRDGDEAAAERELELAVAASPEDGESHFDLGRFLLKRGRVEAAWSSLQRAVELDPGRHEAHFRLAEAALAQESPELSVARQALERYLVRHPTHDEPSHAEARSLLEQMDEAAED